MESDADHPDLEPQPIPKKAQCPECGGAVAEDKVEQNLRAMGYLHSDMRLTCSECDHQWTAGVPIGAFDRPEMADEMQCDSCGSLMLVHWIDSGHSFHVAGDLVLGLKCPDPDCRAFKTTGRDADEDGRVLTGYAQTAGQTEGAEPFGYPADDPDADADE